MSRRRRETCYTDGVEDKETFEDPNEKSVPGDSVYGSGGHKSSVQLRRSRLKCKRKGFGLNVMLIRTERYVPLRCV